jgi:hypothetical protein
MDAGVGVARYVGSPVMPVPAGCSETWGAASGHDLKIVHAVSSASTSGAAFTGHSGVRSTMLMIAGSFPESHASSPPGVFDQ